jgi:hypothetical protein
MARGSIIIILGTTLATAGCFESIVPETPDAGEQPTGDAAVSGKHTTTKNLDGTYTTLVDATSMTEWTHGDFETGAEVMAAGPWDLRFQRFHISTNGGSSGSGGVEVAAVSGVAFAQMTSMPATGWISDAPDGDDTNMDPDYAFEQGDGWYDYDATTHKLTPKPIVWAIKTNGGAGIKLEIVTYYDAAGTAGWLQLHWAALAGEQ